MESEAESLSKSEAAAAVSRFQFGKLLNQACEPRRTDQAGRRISLLGSVDSKAAILLAERAAFPNDSESLSSFIPSLQNISTIGSNDIYSWFMASSAGSSSQITVADPSNHNLKINLIWPCTEKHITKYEAQGVRSVTETPQIYRDLVRPLMQKNRDDGRLNWIYDILDGRAEQEDVMYSKVSENDAVEDEGFMLLPDLNWDRKTIASLHCLGICRRRDIWSVRDLTKKHVPWLRHVRRRLIDATVELYPGLEEDQLKLYIHYQPTYYHFHIHVVNVLTDPGATQAVGKALGLESIIDQLDRMKDDKDGMENATLTYTVGEASEIWLRVFEPLKRESLNG